MISRTPLLSLSICFFCWITSESANIDIAECDPPDYPEWGGYGPVMIAYSPGDIIHYWCDVDTHIGGNYLRRCEDNGDWTGDAPVCDSASPFSLANQTSTAEPSDENDADKAVDFLRNTCSETKSGTGQQWMGMLATPGELFRVSIFMPRGNVAYQVIMMKKDGSEFSCGSKISRIESMNWERHNCPGPSNKDAIGIKIRSLSESPLQICEVVVHSLTTPTCTDPHFPLENGRLQLNRKVATLVCHPGYTKSRDKRLECIRDGVWTRKTLYCTERDWEIGSNEKVVAQP